MMNDVTITGPVSGQQVTTGNPFARQLDSSVNAGVIEIESARAVADAQARLLIAKKFPRDPHRAYERIMAACSRPGLAAEAFYQFNRGGSSVIGASIRLAEVIAAEWGNIAHGIRELSRKDGVSEMEAFAWDLETNTISTQQFTVRHIRDTKSGGKVLTDERDIYELTANQGARRLRSRIFAVLPKDVVDAAEEACRKTLRGDNQVPLADRIKRVVAAFGKYGVTIGHIEGYIGLPLDKVLPDHLIDLQAVYNSIKDGASPSEFFAAPKVEAPAPTPAPAKAKPKPKVEDEPTPTAEPEPEPEPTPAPARVAVQSNPDLF